MELSIYFVQWLVRYSKTLILPRKLKSKALKVKKRASQILILPENSYKLSRKVYKIYERLLNLRNQRDVCQTWERSSLKETKKPSRNRDVIQLAD